MDLYYQHQDFELADNVIRRFAEEYQEYCRYQERNDAASFQQRMDKRMLALERLKPKLELQIQRAEEAKGALQAFHEANASFSVDEMRASDEYRALKQKNDDEQTALSRLRREISGFILQPGNGYEPSPVGIIKRSGWATTNDYLLAPIIWNLAWGFLGAMGCGVLGVLAFRVLGTMTGTIFKAQRT